MHSLTDDQQPASDENTTPQILSVLNTLTSSMSVSLNNRLFTQHLYCISDCKPARGSELHMSIVVILNIDSVISSGGLKHTPKASRVLGDKE